MIVTQLSDKVDIDISGLSKTKIVIIGELKLNGEVIDSDRVTIAMPEKFSVKSSGGEITSKSHKIKVEVGQSALKEDANFYILEDTLADEAYYSLSSHPFQFNAKSLDGSNEIKKFDSKIKIVYQYDLADYETTDENNLVFKYFDIEQNDWVPLPTEIDTKNHVAIGYTDHLTDFDLDVASINQYD